jgi:hypothetical protein
MTMERADLSITLNLERMAPVPAAPKVQGQSSVGEGGEDEPRRHPPPPEKPSAEPAEEDGDQPQHRIDSLA